MFLGVLFLGVQTLEWGENAFSLSRGIGGSIFYIITGFHGLHVAIGVLLNARLAVVVIFSATGVVRAIKQEGVI